MKEKLGKDSPLLKHILPTFAVGCRRPTPGNGYLEALAKENVRVVTDAISEIVPEGIKTSTGEILKVDMLICATGFDMSFCPRYPVIGQDGISLGDQWKDKPDAYLSLAVPNFPNHFSTCFPNPFVCHRVLANLSFTHSVPWTKRPDRTRIRTTHCRARCQVHHSDAL